MTQLIAYVIVNVYNEKAKHDQEGLFPMKELVNLTPRQKELALAAGANELAADAYTDADIEALVSKVTAYFAANSDEEGTPNELGLELETLLDYLEALPVQFESVEEFTAVMHKAFDLVCRYQQKTFLIEHSPKGFVLAEKGRVSTRKTFATLDEALAQFKIENQPLVDVITQLVVIDLILPEGQTWE
ncbi:MAG: hypothetical protein ACRC3A_02715 [Culicoidibacterales bacterium]